MKYVLETNNLSKKYKSFVALDEVNLHIEKGAIYGLIGKNGAGKTTLIRVVTGLQYPTMGAYFLYGVSFNDENIYDVRQRISAIVETPALLSNMTARENLIHQSKLMGMPTQEGIDELLTLVNLENTKKKKVVNFSLGMKQRLGIAIALLTNPDLLILDEPINGLDPEGIVDIRELIIKLNKKKGITILISSHYLDELSKIATHYGFLDRGKLIKEISSVELNDILKKKIEIKTNNLKDTVKYLEKEHIEYKVIDNNNIILYDKINISHIILELAKRNCLIEDIHEKNETLESYFLELMGDSND